MSIARTSVIGGLGSIVGMFSSWLEQARVRGMMAASRRTSGVSMWYF